jgi:hypothetical protein
VDRYSYRAVGERDFYEHEFSKGANPDFGVTAITQGSAMTVAPSDEFKWLWGKAVGDAHVSAGSP